LAVLGLTRVAGLFLRRMSGRILLVMFSLSSVCAQAEDMTIAVWDFDSHELAIPNATPLGHLSRALAEILIEQLLSYPGIRVIERARLREILDEQKLGSSALADEDARLRLGRMAGAQGMIFGSLMSLGDVTRVDVRLVSVQTSQVVAAQDTSARADDLTVAMVGVARALADSLGHGKSTDSAGAKSATNPATLALFDDGLALMDRKDFTAAIEVFKKIILADPGFTAAERQIQLALDKLTRQ
jgi:curli biogenesis system outer membrane secretion channel CsgG